MSNVSNSPRGPTPLPANQAVSENKSANTLPTPTGPANPNSPLLRPGATANVLPVQGTPGSQTLRRGFAFTNLNTAEGLPDNMGRPSNVDITGFMAARVANAPLRTPRTPQTPHAPQESPVYSPTATFQAAASTGSVSPSLETKHSASNFTKEEEEQYLAFITQTVMEASETDTVRPQSPQSPSSPGVGFDAAWRSGPPAKPEGATSPKSPASLSTPKTSEHKKPSRLGLGNFMLRNPKPQKAVQSSSTSNANAMGHAATSTTPSPVGSQKFEFDNSENANVNYRNLESIMASEVGQKNLLGVMQKVHSPEGFHFMMLCQEIAAHDPKRAPADQVAIFDREVFKYLKNPANPGVIPELEINISHGLWHDLFTARAELDKHTPGTPAHDVAIANFRLQVVLTDQENQSVVNTSFVNGGANSVSLQMTNAPANR